VPPHWFRPLNPNPHPMKPGEKIIGRPFKAKPSNRKWAVTAWDPPQPEDKPDPAAIRLPEEDDLEPDLTHGE
jgi:hypothetical protein